jgi:hypothetical protein
MEEDASAGRLIVSTLLKDLPASLDLTHYFDGQPEADPTFYEILKTHPANVVAGSHGLVMARYGMAMTTIIDALYVIQSTVRKFRSENKIAEHIPITLSDATSSNSTPPTIARGDILDRVITVTDLEPAVAERLLQWLYAVAEIKPKLIHPYIFDHQQFKPGGLDECTCVNNLYEGWHYIRT